MCVPDNDATNLKCCSELMVVFLRCEDMVDVRRLKMLQMVQLFKCEEDAAQVWIQHVMYLTLIRRLILPNYKQSICFMDLRK